MKLMSIQAGVLAIPFHTAFKHASAERTTTQSIWVEARTADDTVAFGEGCPREYVTGESLATSMAFVAAHAESCIASIHDLNSLTDWVAGHRAAIDANPAAWAAIELSLLDLIAREANRSVEALLGVPEPVKLFRYTAVLGNAPLPQFELQLRRYLDLGFGAFKVKLSGELARDAAKVQVMKQAGVRPESVRADANNLWRDAARAIDHLRTLDFRFGAIEEPVRPNDVAGMAQIGAELGAAIILDESGLRPEQLAQYARESKAVRWIANIRASKMGGLLRSLEFLAEARRSGFKAIVGAHVGETSVLTRAAWVVAAAARDVLVAQEGAFGTHLLEYDVVDPALVFGRRGELDPRPLLALPGFGLRVVGPKDYVSFAESRA